MAQTNARNYGYDFKPCALAYEDPKIGLQEAKFKIKRQRVVILKKEDKKFWDMTDVFCYATLENDKCEVRSWNNIVPSPGGWIQ